MIFIINGITTDLEEVIKFDNILVNMGINVYELYGHCCYGVAQILTEDSSDINGWAHTKGSNVDAGSAFSYLQMKSEEWISATINTFIGCRLTSLIDDVGFIDEFRTKTNNYIYGLCASILNFVFAYIEPNKTYVISFKNYLNIQVVIV